MIKIFLLTVLCLVGFYSTKAYAHVLIVNSQNDEVGMLFHVTPDDDPIAGPESTIYVDVQSNDIADKTHFFDLTVTHPNGDKNKVLINSADGYYPSIYVQSKDINSLIGTYTFPEKGMYEFELSAVAVNKDTHESYVLTHDQEVTRSSEELGANQYLRLIPVVLLWLVSALLVVYVFVKIKKQNIP